MPPLLVIAVLVTALLLGCGALFLRARRKRRETKPVREPSAFVVLEGNVWEACNVDDIREPWARLATEPIRGFCGVAPGRHRVRTTTGAGDATLDFVAYPGEVLAWRLDTERARWEPHDLEVDTRTMLEGVPASTTDLASAARAKVPGWLVHLRTTVGLATNRGAAVALPRVTTAAEAIERVRKRLVKLVLRAEAEGIDSHTDLLVEAKGLGETLVGRPLARRDLRALVLPVREAATRLSARGDSERAMSVVGLGLAVLPGDPELMVVAGCALAARGEVDEATRALEAALERDRCLQAEDVARAMRARMELRTRHGHRVRV